MNGLPVTVTIIHFQTPDLTQRAVLSFRSFYPSVPLLLIDNGSNDTSTRVLQELQRGSPECTQLVINKKNIHHGPAMDQALRMVQSQYVLFLDSDCEVRHGGFLEHMLEHCQSSATHYAMGKRIFMNDRGFDQPEGSGAHPYIRPICMLIKRDVYLTLPPFERHGAPCLVNMMEAESRGLTLAHFPVEDFVHHEGRGTASRHGYRLGLRGKMNHLLNKIGW